MRRGQRLDVTRLGEQGVDAVGGDVAVAVDAAGDDRRAGRHRLDQHDTERLAVQGRGAEHRRPPQAGELLGVADPPEPRDALVVGRARRAAGGPSGPSLAIHSRVVAGSDRNASSSTARPLRSSWRPQKKIVGLTVGVGGGRRDAVDLHAVEQDVVVPGAQEPLDELQGVLGHHHLAVDAPGEPAQRTGRGSGSSGCARRRGTCRRSVPGASAPTSSTAPARTARARGARRTARR